MTLMLYIWLGIIVLSLVTEMLTAGLTSIWFVPASIIGIILELCKVDPIIQIIVFLVISAVCIIFLRKFSRKSKHIPTNVTDTIIGQDAIVTERIDNSVEMGEVKIAGKHWSARLEGSDTAEVGEHVEVLRISGVKLICKKH